MSQHTCSPICKTLASLYLLEERASEKAKKYRLDPFLSEIHESYAEAIRTVREAAKEDSNV